MEQHDWFKYHLEKSGIYVVKVHFIEFFKANLCLNVHYDILPDGLGDEEIVFNTFVSSRFFCDCEETFDCFYEKEISILDFDVIPYRLDPACEKRFRIVRTSIGKDVLDKI